MLRTLFATVALMCLFPGTTGAHPPGSPTTTVAGVDGASAEMLFPRIEGAGGVFAVAADMPERNTVHRLVLDAAGDERTPAGLNRRLDAAARAVNLYALAGVPPENVKIAVVVHGKATAAVLSDEAFREKFGVANPDAGLLAKLHRAEVEVHVCGQALMHQGYSPDEVHADVRVSLSAMTKLASLQAAGYSLIP